MNDMLTLENRFEFRDIKPEEAARAAEIEALVFPPHEVVEAKYMIEQAGLAPDLFLVAVDKSNGEIAGFLNGKATDEESFRDEFFTDKSLDSPAGRNVMLLGLDILPEYRKQGLAREIMRRYSVREREKGRSRLVLTCLSELVGMYESMGFKDLGKSGSSWGGESWHEMHMELK